MKQFCEATGLSRDTVRFYVRRGLLAPERGSRPGNRYQVFDAAQVERARLVRMAQRLGFSLREIAALAETYSAEASGREGKTSVLRAQIAHLADQERQMRQMRMYLTAKLSWVEGAELGPEPVFDAEGAISGT